MATTKALVAKRNTALTFGPSWSSSVLCALLSLAVIVGVIAADHYKSSQLQQQVLSWQSAAMTSSFIPALNAEYDSDTLQTVTGVASTFTFWLFIGLLTYCIIYGVYEIAHSAHEFEGQLQYVHVSRKQLLRDTALRTVTRLSVLVLWLAYMLLFFRGILPLVLASAHVAAVQSVSLAGLEFAVGSFVVFFVSLHVHVVLLRLALLRPRVFVSRG